VKSPFPDRLSLLSTGSPFGVFAIAIPFFPTVLVVAVCSLVPEVRFVALPAVIVAVSLASIDILRGRFAQIGT